MNSQPPDGPLPNDRPSSPQPETWARPVSRFTVSNISPEAVNINVEGRHLVGPLQGFGQLWQKTYKIRLSGALATPSQVIKAWKDHFSSFWPKGNHFYGPLTGIQPGEVAVLNLAGPGGITMPGGAPLVSTGVIVIYADDESFSFMTPEGHMFAALINFSAYEEAAATVAQVQALIRGNDPLYELGLRLGIIHRAEDDFWQTTLRNLAAYFGVEGVVVHNVTCIDSHVQWSEAKNIWQNAAMRTAAYLVTMPFRRIWGRSHQS